MRALVAIIILAACGSIGNSNAFAGTCAEKSITARGEQARFLWLAKTKARANWRRKVRTTPGLGAPYANWARAENTEENCFSGRFNHLCVFTGTPCLK